MLIKRALLGPSGARSCHTKGLTPLLSTVGQYHSRLSRLPWVPAIHSYLHRPSLSILNVSDVNLSDILLDRQWNNKERWAHSWKLYSGQAGDSQQEAWESGLMSEYWAGVVVTKNIRLRCWPITTCAKKGGREYGFFPQTRDGFGQYQWRVKLRGFQTRAGGFGLFLCIT